ncbi:MAG: AraC family transcriptional regulator [Chloroflexi bacterium]|nr:AraC family transcriptional regulator [Chloroflexota bacterium]
MTNQQETNLDYQQRINRVLVCIQNRLETPPTLNELAALASFSPYHFHRIFTAYMGESLAAYVRRVRLEQAAMQLLHSRQEILEIAFNVGYETQAAFGKAFKKHFGVSPSAYRHTNGGCTAVSIPQKYKEIKMMKPKIKQLEPQTVLFARKTGEYSQAASDAWGVLMGYAYSHKLMKKETQMIGISHDSPDITDGRQLRYDACMTVPEETDPEGEIGKQTIAGGKYAIFLHKGPYENFSQTYDAIFKDWLPGSGMELRNVPTFELYLNRDPRRTKPENLKTEIHVPVQGAKS